MFVISLNNFTGNACGLSFTNGKAETADALLAGRMKLRGYVVEAAEAVIEKPPEEEKPAKSRK